MMFDECVAEVDAADRNRSAPLGSMPLVVISLRVNDPGYQSLQRHLRELSSNGRGVTADSSGHLIQVDRPDVVTKAIESVVAAARRQRR